MLVSLPLSFAHTPWFFQIPFFAAAACTHTFLFCLARSFVFSLSQVQFYVRGERLREWELHWMLAKNFAFVVFVAACNFFLFVKFFYYSCCFTAITLVAFYTLTEQIYRNCGDYLALRALKINWIDVMASPPPRRERAFDTVTGDSKRRVTSAKKAQVCVPMYVCMETAFSHSPKRAQFMCAWVCVWVILFRFNTYTWTFLCTGWLVYIVIIIRKNQHTCILIRIKIKLA